jgi:hypothetical protein
MGLLKMLFEFILELFFDHKDEYTFSSSKFNLKRTVIFILFVLLIFLNIFLTANFITLAGKYIDLKEEIVQIKNNSQASSNSQNTPKK